MILVTPCSNDYDTGSVVILGLYQKLHIHHHTIVTSEASKNTFIVRQSWTIPPVVHNEV